MTHDATTHDTLHVHLEAVDPAQDLTADTLEAMFPRARLLTRVHRAIGPDPSGRSLRARGPSIRTKVVVAFAITASLSGAALASASTLDHGFGHALRTVAPTSRTTFAQRVGRSVAQSMHSDAHGATNESPMMPTVLGASEADATSQIESSGIGSSHITIDVLSASQVAASGGDAYPSGTVLAQVPAIDSAVTQNTAVTLMVTP